MNAVMQGKALPDAVMPAYPVSRVPKGQRVQAPAPLRDPRSMSESRHSSAVRPEPSISSSSPNTHGPAGIADPPR
jgi:hypothetical protein